MSPKKEAPQTEQFFPREEPVYDFSAPRDFPNADQAHLNKDQTVSEGIEKQGMGPGATDVGREAVRRSVTVATQEAKRIAQAAKPERMSARRKMDVDVNREAAKRKPGLPRLERLPGDAPVAPPPKPPKEKPSTEEDYETLNAYYGEPLPPYMRK